MTDLASPWNLKLQRWLRESGVSVTDLAERLDCRWAVAHRLCYDDIVMTPELANNLEGATGIPSESWLSFDQRH